MANNFNDNVNKKNLNGNSISYTTYRTNYPNDEAMKNNGGVPSGGSSNLEDNKEATINVSTYTDPVEVTPTQGKDGMKKVTVSLSNMPTGTNILYEWAVNVSSFVYLSVSTSPSTLEDLKSLPQLKGMTGGGLNFQSTYFADATNYVRTSDNEFTVTVGGSSKTFTRGNNDIEIWNVPPEVETTKQATIDVSTYDPSNKPVITPTAGKQSMAEVEVTLSNIPSGGSDTPYFIQCTADLGEMSGIVPILIVPDITKLSIFIATTDTNLSVLSSDENRVGWHSSSDFDSDSENVGDNGISLAGYGVYGIYTYNLGDYPSSLKYDGHLYNFPQDLNHVTINPCIPVSSQATPPTSDTPSGTVASGTTVHLSTTETGGEIYYCIEGDTIMSQYDPDGVEITETCTVRAVTVVDDKAVSEELVLNFTVE